MKREKRIETIHKRSREYAKSGLYPGWQNIEWKLREEGLKEARNELVDSAIRAELDELCHIAQSSEETERRTKFKEWINNTAIPSETLIKQTLTDAQIVGLDQKCMLKEPDCTITIEREFGSTKIKALSSGYNRDGDHFTHDCDIEGNPTFDTIDSKEFARLIIARYEEEMVFFKNQ
ncbi:MAG TPA: hypothetical protein VJZ49_07730 [Syntrophales bacterium]|nr:hypothetical protein [Syntrophales bacterium]